MVLELSRLQARERRAQKEAREQLYPRVLAVCTAMLKDPGLAEETAEDILMDFLFDHVDKVQQQGAMGAYLRTLTVRHCVWLRKRMERQDGAIDPEEVGAGSEDEALAILDTRRLYPRLVRCLTRLLPTARQIVSLRYDRRMTQAEIGEILGVSKQYAGRVLQKSLESLKQCLEQDQ